tara:strand:+ start:1983 stop:2279 length:297 start_codon:yes stop_codon:yes gene_type:complete
MVDQKLVINPPSGYDLISITLDETQHPIAFANKLTCLTEGAGMTEMEARHHMMENPIEMELYYEIGSGLMAVESEIVECGNSISSPYGNGEYLEPDGL